jgi:lysophospholipase L1-like esterase
MKKMILLFCCFLIIFGTAWSQTKLACIGNSITQGDSVVGHNIGCYPDTLRKLLGSNYVLENDGVSSTTAIRQGSYPYWTKGKLANVFAFKPNWITIKLGTNDSKPDFWSLYSGQYKKDYLALIDTLNTLSTKPKIWLVLPCPCWRTETNRPNDANLLSIITIVKQIATERSLPIIDVRTPLLNFQAYFKDGIHPNTQGADTIAHVFYRTLMASTAITNFSGNNRAINGQAKSLRMILRSGLSVTALCRSMAPGISYMAKAYDAKGSLCASELVRNPEAMKSFGREVMLKSTGLRFVKLERITQ